ncbi:MAG: hypothetical protein AAFQ94_30920 [Bacteroidota bacterium]
MEVTELMIYKIKEKHRGNTKDILTDLRTVVNKIEGLKSIKSYSGCNDKDQLMDLVIWESIEAANNSKEQFHSDPDYERIAGYFDEMDYFNQFYAYL